MTSNAHNTINDERRTHGDNPLRRRSCAHRPHIISRHRPHAPRLLIAQISVQDASVNGIEIVRSAAGDDGTIVVDNRIENIKAGPGGTGQYGNAINAFRANNVIVRGNRLRNCDYSGVRGNSASNIQIVGNTGTDAREVALYSEFTIEGAIIANNVLDGCSPGDTEAN